MRTLSCRVDAPNRGIAGAVVATPSGGWIRLSNELNPELETTATQQWQASQRTEATTRSEQAAWLLNNGGVAQHGPATAMLPAAGGSAELEGLFWQSVMNSTDPSEFEAYLAQFPNGTFQRLAETRVASLLAASENPVEQPARQKAKCCACAEMHPCCH